MTLSHEFRNRKILIDSNYTENEIGVFFAYDKNDMWYPAKYGQLKLVVLVR